MSKGNLVLLKGQSDSGKETITKYGDKWIVIARDPNGHILVCPAPTEETAYSMQVTKWISLSEDPDFEIMG